MAKFVVEFSPPEKIKSEPDDVTDSVINYRMVLAPFQKQTQVEFNNIKLKETSVRFLTVVNPLEKSGQFVISPPSDGVYFDVYEFSLEPNSQCELSITWKPTEYGNIRKLIKIEQMNSNRKYDFVILGNCNRTTYKKKKGNNLTYSKTTNSNLNKKQLNCSQKKVLLKPNKTKIISCKSEIINSVENSIKIVDKPISAEKLQFPIRRLTYFVGEKENFPISKNNVLGRDTILTSPERSIKRPDQSRQDYVFNNHFNLKNLNNSSSPISDNSLEKPFKNTLFNNSQFNEFFTELTPLKSTENLISPLSSMKPFNGFDEQLTFDYTDGSLASNSSFKSEEALNLTITNTIEDKSLSMNFCNEIIKTPIVELKNKFCTNFEVETINPESFVSSPEVNQSSDFVQIPECADTHIINQCTMINLSGTKSKRTSFSIKNSKNKFKQCRTSPQTTRLRTPKLDKCDQYFKSLTNPYYNNAVDPFLKMSEYYETEWLNRQEFDMIRWLNALLTPTDELVDKDQTDDLEQATIAWVEASKTCHKNKPMQFATQKDLFVAQLYRHSPQQWTALRKATTNLITSTNMSSVLSKLTISIEKDLITVRDDRQIHLDLSLKKKIIDLLKCYNPLWVRIGLEAIYGQIIPVKPRSNDLDGIGWFVRKNLFNNDFVKQKYTKTTVLQVNLPSYNIAMKKFILRKILMLIYFLDRAKDQQLIRHNPCLFKTDSAYKSSYDLLMGFCADMVIAHGDIVRRLRNIGYNLTHKQTHLDEVNYAVKSLNDLRDGTRITKVVEILFKGSPLSQKLRLPAISKLQKIHNVNLAFMRISEHITIEGNISTRDIVNGHREKILSLFWQIIYKYLTPQYNDAATKIQNWWRNRSLKLVILKRIRVKQIAKRHLAAAKIQGHVRGFLTRKQWPHLQTELIKNREMLHAASTKIKHYLKDKLKFLTDERKRFIILRRTVVFIQNKFRNKMAMVKERNMYLKTIQSTITIQKVFRGFILRKNWPRIKKDLMTVKTKRVNAINIIKHVLRKNLPLTLDRIRFLKLKQTTLYVESQYMATRSMKLEMEHYTNLKISTKYIQQKFRGNIAMKKERENYLKTKQSVLLIQKIFRGLMVRKYWPEKRNQLILEKKKRVDAINIVKRTIRKVLPQTQERLNFLKLRISVLFVQQTWRANSLMKMQREWYTSSQYATVFVQRKFRANIAMKTQREEYLKTRSSTLVIQNVYRGYVIRKSWSTVKNVLMAEKIKRANAAIVIIRFLRKSLPATLDHLYYEKLKRSTIAVQRRFRANLETKVQQNKFQMLKNSTIVLQRRFRANHKARLHQDEYLKLKATANGLQKAARGYLFRQNIWPALRTKLLEDRLRLVQCSDIIKRFLRRYLPVTDDRAAFLRLKTAVIVLQNRYRANLEMRIQRCAYTKARSATILVQSATRGYLFRQQIWPVLLTELTFRRQILIQSANTIKRALRKNLSKGDRHRFLELQSAIVTVQLTYRAKRQAQQYQKLRTIVILVQRTFRAKQKRNEYIHIRTVTIMLQAYARGFLMRQRWPEMKHELQAHRHQLIAASNTLKRFLRQCLPTTFERSNFLSLKRAAVTIQTHYRAFVVARLDRTKYLTLRYNVIVLQRCYKARLATRAAILLQAYVRGYLVRRRWPELKNCLEINRKHAIDTQWVKNCAASKIQAVVRGFLARKKMPEIKNQLKINKQMCAATLIQAVWRGYRVRNMYQCRRETVRIPINNAQTLGKRHNDVLDVLNKQKKHNYSYKELSTVFWNLDICTSLSRELCVKTVEGSIIDCIFRFLVYSNQSQPSMEARDPAIRVLTNLLRYHETSQTIWKRAISIDIVKELIKIMKTSCGKFGTATKVYCSIATWIWIALQDPEKKRYIKRVPIAIIDFKFMMQTLNRKYKTHKVDKKLMILPSTRPTWFIGSKCQKCFESDLYGTTQICKMLNIIK